MPRKKNPRLLLKQKVREWMQREVQVLGSRVNMTWLAESAAHAFNHDEWLDDPDHWVWDLAAELYERENESE